MKSELKPCPFCGEKLGRDKYGNHEHIANGCILSWVDSEYGKIFFRDVEEDISAWNRRAEDKFVTDTTFEENLDNRKEVKCLDCEYLMFSDFYGECSKAYKGIVRPWDSCGKGKRRARK